MKELSLNKLEEVKGGKFWGTENVCQNVGYFCYCEHTYYVLWVAVETETSIYFGNC